MDDLEASNVMGLEDIIFLEEDQRTTNINDDNLMPKDYIPKYCDELVCPDVGMWFDILQGLCNESWFWNQNQKF